MSAENRVPFERQDTAQVQAIEQKYNNLHPNYSSRQTQSQSPSPHRLRRVPSNISTITEEDGAPYPLDASEVEGEKNRPVKWLELPKKDQLIILTFIRLAEPITQTSLNAYMFYMLKWFDDTKTDAQISSQAGLLSGTFTAAQCLTAVMYGRLADGWLGRKNVLLIGLSGTFISALGFGFSTNFVTAMFFRMIGGALNGNVGVMRTMISEIVKEKKYQPKAFLVMPLTFNVGVLVGPLLGGWLENPVTQYPQVFGPGSTLGGKEGVQWMKTYPYALPNLVMASFLLLSFLVAFFGLEETSEDRRGRPDIGLAATRWVAEHVFRCGKRRSMQDYSRLEQSDTDDVELSPRQAEEPSKMTELPLRKPKLPWRRIFTKNVSLTFLNHGLLAMHLGAFNNLWFLFLSTPRFNPAKPQPPSHKAQQLPFSFTGGLGLPPRTIGFALGIIGVLGLMMQLGVYSKVTHKLGVLRAFRFAVLLFPVAYLFDPFLAMVPTKSKSPAAADGPWLWMAISSMLFIQTVGRTFTLPITQILINNCTPHPSVLGTVHGIGQMVSSGMRTVGPILWSWLYGVGLEKGMVGLAWWSLAAEACFVFVVSGFVYEGSGHEIRLEGDEEDDD